MKQFKLKITHSILNIFKRTLTKEKPPFFFSFIFFDDTGSYFSIHTRIFFSVGTIRNSLVFHFFLGWGGDGIYINKC